MPEFPFKLETVRKYRQQQLRTAEAALARCNRRLHTVRESQQRVLSQLDSASRLAMDLFREGNRAVTCVDAHRYIAQLRRQLGHINAEVENAEMERQTALQEYKERNLSVESLDALREIQLAELVKAARRRDAKLADELAMLDWRRDGDT